MSKIESYNSRTAYKFIARLPEGMREKLSERAKAEHRSMNDLVTMAIQKHLEQGEAFDELLRIVQQAIKPQGGAFVSIRREYLGDLVRAVIEGDEEGLAQHSDAMIAALAVLGGGL